MKKSSKVSEEPQGPEIVPSMESAAREAALADGVITADGVGEKSKKLNLRRGKWTTEEEEYANRLISEFKLGLLPLADGTTLRTFLSKLLNCDPMRISKKFVGQNCIGKQVFRRRQQDLDKLTPEQIDKSRKELAELERKFQDRVLQTNRIMKSSGKDGTGSDDEQGSSLNIPPWMQEDKITAEAPKSNNKKSTGSKSGNGASSSVPPASSSSIATSNSSETAQYPAGPLYQQNGFNHLPEGDYTTLPSINPPIMYSNGYPSYYPVPHQAPGFMVPGPVPTLKDSSSNAPPTGTSSGSFPRAPSFDLFYGGAPLEMSQYRQSFAYLGPDGLPANASFGFSGQEWPSMGNLLNAGESMENIAQLIQQYQGQNSDATPTQAEDSEGRKTSAVDKDRRAVEEIGYPLDDPAPPSSSKPFGFPMYRTRSGDQEGDPNNQNGVPTAISSEAYAMMTSMYGRHTEGNMPPNNTMNMPRNSSIDNFWMLVNLGDLPRPDQGVLSETLWQSKQSMNPPPPQNHNGSLDQAKSSNALQKRGIDDKVKTENNIGKKPKLDSLFSK